MPKTIIDAEHGVWFKKKGSGCDLHSQLDILGTLYRPQQTYYPTADHLTVNLTDNDTGKLILSDSTTKKINFILPEVSTVTSGWNVKIRHVNGFLSTIKTYDGVSSLEQKIIGLVVTNHTGAETLRGVSTTTGTTITLAAGVADGTTIDIYSDGSFFYLVGCCGGGSSLGKLTIA